MSIFKRVVATAALAASMTVAAGAALAQDFPSQPVTIILNSAPGSGVDAMARTLAVAVERELGQRVVVTNRPGGDGAVAMSELLRAPADGYLIWGVTKTFPVALNTTLQGMFEMEDFQPLVRAEIDPFAIGVLADSPWATLDELLDAARSGDINVGGFGSSSPHGLFNFLLARESDSPLSWIPFNSSGEAMTAVLGGHVDAIVSNPSVLASQVQAGSMRILAVATEERIADLPEIATFRELGYDLVDSQWRGFFLKADTPDDVVAALDTAFRDAMNSPEFTEYLANSGQINGYIGPDEFETFVHSELELVTEVADDFNAYMQ